jgi:hypothetical protein
MRKFDITVPDEIYDQLVLMALSERRNYRQQAGWLVERDVAEWVRRQAQPEAEVALA